MVGDKESMKESLQARLSFGLTFIILGAALVGGTFAYFSSQQEAHELQDDVLRQVASLFKRQHWITTGVSNGNYKKDSDPESRLYVQFIAPSGETARETQDMPSLPTPSNIQAGMQTLLLGEKSYRVFVSDIGEGRRIVVAQETAVRDEIARNSALSTLVPFLLLVPILVAMVSVLVRRVFRPVLVLAADIEKRTEQDLHSIAGHNIPVEIEPFIKALNKLLEKIKASVDEQRRFIADAAHELRTPLAALSLQAERLNEADITAADTKERMGALWLGIQRSRKLLEQLLSMARAQADNTIPSTTVSAHRILFNVLEDLLPMAEEKNIDIGIVDSSEVDLWGNEHEWEILLRNLVSNAICYAPTGGRVDLSVIQTPETVSLVIADNGPGIPEEEWGRVFEPFYRVAGNNLAGSGLGLSIASAITRKFGATIRLDYADGKAKSGLRVVVSIGKMNNPTGKIL